MNSRADVESLLNKLSQYVPVRHRLVLTRRKTVRARFIILPAFGASALVLLATAMLSPAISSMNMSGEAQMASAATPVILGDAPVETADAGPTLLERFHLSQKRLKRSGDSATVAEDLAAIEPSAGNEELALAAADPSRDPSQPLTPQVRNPQEKTVKIGTGDTLTGVLNRAGLSSDEAYQVVEAVRKHVDPRALKPGQTLNIKFDHPKASGARNPAFQFASLNMAVDPLRTVSVARSAEEEDYRVDMHEKSMQKHLYAQEATVENSLFGSAAKAGIPVAIISEAIRIYSWNTDFQRDIHEGDKIQVMYEQYETEDGVKVKTGNLIYAKLVMGDTEVPIYRYEQKDGNVDYFQPNGRSIKKTLMKTPIDGARISSGFGFRQHPILGYNKMHKGVDFAAATGTPIYAAGDGTVVKAGKATGYGNFVKIRHNNQLSTAYGHMSRIATASGARVHQGQIIGYVGMTGAATGPHLHYEVLVNNAQVNPRGVNLPTGQALEGNQLKLFKAYAVGIDRSFNAAGGTRVAQNATKPFSGEASIR
ncbi:MAG: metalloendopeptidase-like rane protein [Micavibrio sp.]|nr:metalloendopeptidase-like rane protein [Micavibrio sp.]